MILLHVISLIFCIIIHSGSCAKILAIFPAPGYSQFILGEKLLLELCGRGHELTVISPYQPKNPPKNYQTILVDGIIDLTQDEDLFFLEDENIFKNMMFTYEYGDLLTEYILAHEKVQKLIHSEAKFDLVIVEQFFNEAHKGFAQHFNASLVTFSSIGPSEWNTNLVGGVNLPSVSPVSFSGYTNYMNFPQRLRNAFAFWFDFIYKNLLIYPQQQQYLNKYFPKPMDLGKIIYNSSLMLLNSHVTTSGAFALPTAAVEIGSFHVESKKLPQVLQDFLDQASDGAIFFSMGSNLRSSNLSKEKLEGILKAFSKIKQRVLWKFEDENPPGKPDNVLVSKWLPQSAILEHPNVVAFITHGGLLSVTETVFWGVPIIGIPVFGDQKMNVARAERNGFAVSLSLQQINEETLSKALKEILENSKYEDNARKMSNIIRDQPIRPIDLAMFSIDLVLNHNGAQHLKSAAVNLNWFQLYSLDVICFILLLFFIIFKLFKLLIKKIFNTAKIHNKQNPEKNKAKKLR